MKNDHYDTLKSEIAYNGKFISIIKNDVVFPNGKPGVYEVFQKSDFVLVIPKLNDKFLLVGQYRYPTGKYSIEFPQGGIGKGESTIDAARRELEEETEHTSNELVFLGEHYPCQSLSRMKCNMFYTDKLTPCKAKKDDSEYGMRLHPLMLAQLSQKIEAGEIVDAPTIAALGSYLLKNGGFVGK